MKTPPTSPGIPASPTLTLDVRKGVDFALIRDLEQTKMVYDQLLKDKQAKLGDRLLKQKKAYDAKCNELAKINMDKALEHAVWARNNSTSCTDNTGRICMSSTKITQEKLNIMKQALQMSSQQKK